MAFDAAISKIQNHFGITKLDDWSDVEPEWILALDGVGPATLDHVRIYLALRDRTLKNDQTPEFWKRNIDTARIGKAMSEDDLLVPIPFTILVDNQEKHPFGFQNITADVSDMPGDLVRMIGEEVISASDVRYQVPIKYVSLGAGNGDYTIDGYQGRIHIERKSLEDCQSTVLSYGDRKDRFDRELENLASMEAAAVVVEASFGSTLAEVKQHGKKTVAENRKILFRRILSLQMKFRIPWVFCDSRAFAEKTTFHLLRKFWKDEQDRKKKAAKGVVEFDRDLADL